MRVVPARAPAPSSLAVRMCLRMPGWDLQQMHTWCPGPAPAPSHGTDFCRDASVKRDRSPVFLGFFLPVSTFTWYIWLISGWPAHLHAGKPCSSFTGFLEEIVFAKGAVACSEIALQ